MATNPYSLRRNMRAKQAIASRPVSSTPLGVGRKKEDPGALKGARVFRRMGEGLGAGGHSTRRYHSTQRHECRSCPAIIFALRPFAATAAGASAPAPLDRSAARPADHRETPDIASGYEAAPGLRHDPRRRNACRQETGWVDDLLTNPSKPPGELPTAPSPKPAHVVRRAAAVMPDRRDSSETGRQRADIPVNRCG
jgi:hypothetical protein